MASTSETGHAKNVANFEDLISFCTGYGASYNPTKASIQLAALNTLKTDGENAVKKVTQTATTFINATNARQIIFDPIKKLSTRIVNAYSTTDASSEAVDDTKTINRKIQGSRKGKGGGGKTTAGTPETPGTENPTPGDDKQISVSQQSYDSLIDNFKKMIEMVSSEPSYKPNEVDLQLTTLNTLSADLSKKNTEVINATTDISNARIARNKTLYNLKTGLYDVAQEVKKYVKSVFGATSPQYKQVSKIKFTKPRN